MGYNTRVRGMVGFVSNSISNDIADRAVGGGQELGRLARVRSDGELSR